MKAIVVYTSRYGSTEQYARWLAEALDCPARKLREVTAGDLAGCDTILYGGGLYAGSVAGLRKFLSMLGAPGDRRVALFLVGMTNPENRDYYDRVARQSIPAELGGQIRAFGLRGNQLYSRMSPLHRLMMRVPKAMVQRKPLAEQTEDERKLVETFGQDVVFTQKEGLRPILDWLEG